MKKILVLLVMLIVIAGCGNTKYNAKKIQEKIDNKETFVLYIGSSTCEACKLFKPVLAEVAKNYNVEYTYWEIDTDSTSTADKREVAVNSLGLDENFGTPTVIVITDGKNVADITGFTPYAALKEFFVENGIIKE